MPNIAIVEKTPASCRFAGALAEALAGALERWPAPRQIGTGARKVGRNDGRDHHWPQGCLSRGRWNSCRWQAGWAAAARRHPSV